MESEEEKEALAKLTAALKTAATPPGLLSRRQMAQRLGVSTDTLDRLHKLGIGPECVEVGRRRLYQPKAGDEWADAGGVKGARARKGGKR